MQETRKDPRAKVLSMTVRYKSATLDEFIEHHSHDVSRGGMFIKTPSPFPPGTLLKFEVRISEEQKVMQGVGRVVWKRDAPGDAQSPTGMGVKFIKLDDDSKHVIENLVGKRGGAEGAFEVGEKQAPGTSAVSGAAATGSAGPAIPRAEPRPRKGTMLGLGAVKLPEAPPSAPPAAAATGGDGFFPQGGAPEQPNPEDRTVMRQAAELLREALREAGGSMDEVTGGTSTGSSSAVSAELGSSQPPAEAPQPGEARPATPASTPPLASSMAEPSPAVISERPRAAAAAEPPEPAEIPALKSGGSKAVWMLLAVIALGAAIFFITQRKKPQESPPEPAQPPVAAAPAPTPEPAPAPSAAPIESASAVTPVESASAAPAETPAEKGAREKAEAAAKAAEEAAAKKAAAEAKKAEAAAAAAAKKAEAAAAAAAKKAEAAATAAAKKAEAPAAPTATSQPKPKAAAPKPAPAEESDNPY